MSCLIQGPGIRSRKHLVDVYRLNFMPLFLMFEDEVASSALRPTPGFVSDDVSSVEVFREDEGGEGLAVKSACPVTEHELCVVPYFNLTPRPPLANNPNGCLSLL